MLKLFSRELTREGYKVTAVENGQACIEKVADGGYDLILCDVDMPQKDGFEVLAEAKAIDPDLEVVLITGGATMERAIEAVLGGAADFLCKPIDDFDAFFRLVKRTIERRHLRLQNQRLVSELRELNENLADKVSEQTEELREAYDELKGRVLTPLAVAANIIHHQEGRGLGLPIVRRQMDLLGRKPKA